MDTATPFYRQSCQWPVDKVRAGGPMVQHLPASFDHNPIQRAQTEPPVPLMARRWNHTNDSIVSLEKHFIDPGHMDAAAVEVGLRSESVVEGTDAMIDEQAVWKHLRVSGMFNGSLGRIIAASHPG